MFPIKAFEARFQAVLDELDALAEESGNEALEELNAEFEDTLFMLTSIDPRDADATDDIRETLEALDALSKDYARQPDTSEYARRIEGLIRMAEGELGA